MRAFHLSWLSFCTAFTGWFALAPLAPTIRQDLNITKEQIGDANIASVSSTILARILVGPLCDKFGPRRVMAAVLLLGAIPVGLAGLVTTASSLIVARFFIGILGASFVPCQFWTSHMFASDVVGSANAIVGGWGNMGAGVTYLLMPLVVKCFETVGLSQSISWRVAMVIPAVLLITVGLLTYNITDDCPEGDWSTARTHAAVTELDVHPDGLVELHKSEDIGIDSGICSVREQNLDISRPSIDSMRASMDVTADRPLFQSSVVQFTSGSTGTATATKNGTTSVILPFLKALTNFNVIIFIFYYACCFGVELAVDNIIGEYFYDHFFAADGSRLLSKFHAGVIGSLFGLMNIFSRGSGGIISDVMNKKYGLAGRIWVQFVVLLLQGVFLIIFSFTKDLTYAIILLLIFSYFTQAGCGSTYSMVPYIIPESVGTVSGLIGAGGNLGGVLAGVVFRMYATNPHDAFWLIGVFVVATSALSVFVRIQKQMMLSGLIDRFR